MPDTPPRPLTREIAAILRGAAARRGVNQTELSDGSGISQSQMSKVLRGTKPIDLDLFEYLCGKLGLSMVAVVAEAEQVAGTTDRAAQLAREIADAGLSEKNRREAELAMREELDAHKGEPDGRAGDGRRLA